MSYLFLDKEMSYFFLVYLLAFSLLFVVFSKAFVCLCTFVVSLCRFVASASFSALAYILLRSIVHTVFMLLGMRCSVHI